MSWLAALSPRIWAYAAAGALLAVLIGLVLWRGHVITGLRADLLLAQQANAGLKLANSQQESAIEVLTKANQDWKRQAESATAAQVRAAGEAAEYRRRLAATPVPKDTAPDCRAILDAPIKGCPVLAEQLRGLLEALK